MKYNLMPGLIFNYTLQTCGCLSICFLCIINFHWAAIIFPKPRGQHEQGRKSQTRPGLKFRLRYGWEKMVLKRRIKYQLQNSFHTMEWESLLTAENWYCDSTYTVCTPLGNTSHLYTKIISEELGPHEYGGGVNDGSRCDLWNLCPTHHYIRF